MMHRQNYARSVRLTQIQHLLHMHPQGLSSTQVASLCGVCTRTVQRDLHTLESEMGIPLTEERGKYGIMGGYNLPPVTFSLFEAMALFLIARLVIRQTDEFNPHVQRAITAIATALPPSLASRFLENIQTMTEKRSDAASTGIFEMVALAWGSGRRMRILYHSYSSGRTSEWLVSPYFIEASGTGYSTYIIGEAEREGEIGIRTFKLDRIKEAELLNEGFVLPEGLRQDELLRSAWGVVTGDEVMVKLLFSPSVTRRVKESLWHPSQQIEDLPDGGCMFAVRVGSTLEITPWIRGWGPDVEVLEPVSLRQEFTAYARMLTRMYETASSGEDHQDGS